MMTAIQNLLRLSPILVLVLLGLAACGQVPVATQWKLRGFDPLTFDPSVPRAAVVTTNRIRALPGAAKVSFRHWVKGAEDAKTEEVFTLAETNETAAIPIADGERLTIFRVSSRDIPRIRALQAMFEERRRTAPGTTGAEVKTDVKGCRIGDLPASAVLATLYLKLDDANGFLPFLKNVDLRKLTADEGLDLDQEVAPCPPPAKTR